MKKFRIIIALIICLPVFIPGCIIAMLSEIFFLLRLKRLGNLWLHFWLSIVIRWIWLSFGASVEVKGKENVQKRGVKACYICNHESMMDIPALFYSGIWAGVVAKMELRKVFGLNILMKELGCVFMDRKNIRQSLQAILKGVENIKSGRPMAICPEGTRSKDGTMGSFKAGAFKMATKSKALVIPVTFKNTRCLLEDAYTFRRIKVYVNIGKPIDTESLNEDEMRKLPERVENIIRKTYEALPSCRKK